MLPERGPDGARSIREMLKGPTVLTLVAMAMCAAACTSAPREVARTATAPTSTITTITTTSVPLTTTTAPTFGIRGFSVSGVLLTGGNWLTVGLHPTTVPVELHVSGANGLEVCPAGLDGGLKDSSWPRRSIFTGCRALDATGSATLPATNGSTRVAFAIRSASNAANLSSLAVTVAYDAADSFVEVIPPATTSHTYLTVTYTPTSTTTAVFAAPVNGLVAAPGYSFDVMQAGRALTQTPTCDFPTDLRSCYGGVTPGVVVSAQLVGQGGPVVFNVGWK